MKLRNRRRKSPWVPRKNRCGCVAASTGYTGRRAGRKPSTSSRISGRRIDAAMPASTSSPRAPPPPVTTFEGAMPATGICASSVAPLCQGTAACALSAAPPATGVRASSVAPLSYGIIQATGVLCLGHHSSQHRHGSPRTKRRPPPATRRAVVRLLRLHVTPFSEGVLLLRLPPMRWRSV